MKKTLILVGLTGLLAAFLMGCQPSEPAAPATGGEPAKTTGGDKGANTETGTAEPTGNTAPPTK